MNTENSSVKDYSTTELYSRVFFSLEGDIEERYKRFLCDICQIKPERIAEHHAIQKALCYLAPLAKDMEIPLIDIVNSYLEHTIEKNGYDYIEEIENCAIDLMSVHCATIQDYMTIKDAVKMLFAISKTIRLALRAEATNHRPFVEPDYIPMTEGGTDND